MHCFSSKDSILQAFILKYVLKCTCLVTRIFLSLDCFSRIILPCFSDGQKLAKSLSSSINKKVLSIEKVLQPFNKKVLYLNSFIPGMREKVIEKRMAFDMDSEMYTQLEIVNVDPRIPICLKVKAVNLYLTWERSLEEITLLDRDAENVIAFILHERQMLQSAIGNLAGTSSYIIGSRSLLYEELSRLTFLQRRPFPCLRRPIFCARGQ